MSSDQTQQVKVVVITEDLANKIRNYMGQRPYDEVAALQNSLVAQVQELSPAFAEMEQKAAKYDALEREAATATEAK